MQITTLGATQPRVISLGIFSKSETDKYFECIMSSIDLNSFSFTDWLKSQLFFENNKRWTNIEDFLQPSNLQSFCDDSTINASNSKVGLQISFRIYCYVSAFSSERF